MEMIKIERSKGVFVKVRPEDKDRFLATYPGAKVADDDKAEDKAEAAPEAPKRAEEPREAESKAVAPFEAEDKAVSMPNPTFRARRSER